MHHIQDKNSNKHGRMRFTNTTWTLLSLGWTVMVGTLVVKTNPHEGDTQQLGCNLLSSVLRT